MRQAIFKKHYYLAPVGDRHWRIVSNIDIPHLGVKVGDLGAITDTSSVMEDNGKCWADADTWLLGNVSITDDAVVRNSYLCGVMAAIRVKDLGAVVNSHIVADCVVGGAATLLRAKVMAEFVADEDAEAVDCCVLVPTKISGEDQITGIID